MSANYVNIAGGTTYTLTVNPATLNVQNNQFRLICKTAGGAITIILPKISDFGTGIDSNIFIDDADDMSSINNITVLVDESNTLENAASFVLNEDGQKVEIFIASKTEYGISGNSAGSANSTLLAPYADGSYPIESNPSQVLSAVGISKAYATLVYQTSDNNLVTISFPDLVTLIGGVYFVDDESGATTSISFPKLEEVTAESFFVFSQMLLLTTIDLPKLKNVNNDSQVAFSQLPALLTLDLPELLSVPQLYVVDDTLLESFSAPKLAVAVGMQIQSNPALTSISLLLLNQVNGDLEIDGNTLLPSISLPVLESITGGYFIYENDSLVSVSNPLLETVSGEVDLDTNLLLASVNLPVLVSCDDIYISDNAALLTVDLSALTTTTADNIYVGSNAALTTILINAALTTISIDFSVNALTQASVDDILDKLDIAGQSGGTLDLTGGTNATPSAAGLTSKANLVGKGWTVTNN